MRWKKSSPGSSFIWTFRNIETRRTNGLSSARPRRGGTRYAVELSSHEVASLRALRLTQLQAGAQAAPARRNMDEPTAEAVRLMMEAKRARLEDRPADAHRDYTEAVSL